MGIERPWKIRAEHHSPRYTTQLSDVPVVHADTSKNRPRRSTSASSRRREPPQRGSLRTSSR